MHLTEKNHPLFRAKTGGSVKGSRSYRYEVYVYDGSSPSGIHFFQDDMLWQARQQAIHFYNGLLIDNKSQLVELNFTSVLESGDVSIMELISNAPNHPIAEKMYGKRGEYEYTNHWMNSAAFEFDMYLFFAYEFSGYVENLKYGYSHPEGGQLYGDLHVLPGTGVLYNEPGLVTEVTFKNCSLPDLKYLMNGKY